MKLVIAEKKNQAENLAAPFPKKTQGFGFIEVLPCPTFPKGAYFTWAAGHLVSLMEPEEYDPKFKEWKMEHLPILPDQFKMRPTPGKERLYTHLKKLLQNKGFTEVVNACDSGREGEAIFSYIYQLSGCKKPVKRLWTSSLTKDAVAAAFEKLLPESDKKNLYHEAYARSCADWLVGMNTSRAYSILLREKGVKVEKGESFSTGRVQTPVLALIVEREEAMENFVSTPFWEVIAEFTVNGQKYIGQWVAGDTTRLTDKDKAVKLAAWCEGKQSVVEDIAVDTKESHPPHLFSLSALQTLANKLFKIGPEAVLEACQGLYDKGFQSYPRTDSSWVTEDEAKQFPEILSKISDLTSYSRFFPTPVKSLIGNKRYVDASKVSDHYAIIPTEMIPQMNELSENERMIYDLVVKSLIAAHYEAAIFEHTTIMTYVGDRFSFQTKGKRMLREGWRIVLSTEDPDEKEVEEPMLPNIKTGDEGLTETCEAKEGWTSAPKRLTQGDLIPLMKSAGNNLGDKELESIMRETHGLGTEATRAAIIKRLKDQKYIEVKKNLVYPTEKGRILIRAIGLSALSSAETTAKWEQKLSEIGNGRYTHTSFIEQAKKLAAKLVTDAAESVQSMDIKTSITQPKAGTESGRPKPAQAPKSADSTSEVSTASEEKNQVNDAASARQSTTPPKQDGQGANAIEERKGQQKASKPVFDDTFLKAVTLVIEAQQASVSLIQRKMTLGYTDSARLVDRMESLGIVGPYEGNSPRKVLMTLAQVHQLMKSNPTVPESPDKDHQPTHAQSQESNSNTGEQPTGEDAAPPSSYQQTPMHDDKPIRQVTADQNLGPCKKCGRPVIDKKVIYGCSAWEDTACDFKLSKTIKSVPITREHIIRLLQRGDTGLIRGFVQKSNDENKPETTFDAVLVVDASGKIGWKYPNISVLKLPTNLLKAPDVSAPSNQEMQKEFKIIEREAETLKMPVKVTRATYGPRVTRFEIAPEPGINIAAFKRYKANFQRALMAEKIFLYLPVPGSDVIGIEVPSKTPYTVNLRSMLENKEFLASKKALTFPIGMDMGGQPVYADLADMPHLLVAGTTGSGKSVFLNELIVSLLYGQTPDKLRFLFIDPKKVELSIFENIPHLFGPIVTDVQRAGLALKKLVVEMEKRYETLRNYGVRNIGAYIEKVLSVNPKAPPMPYIVLVIDELADLMIQQNGPEVEDLIQRLAQLARAAGIHMVVATQRPSKEVISPIIKANLPVRIAFQVASNTNSMIILDEPGAEDLLGKGDMFYLPKDGAKRRLVSAFVTDEEIERVVDYLTRPVATISKSGA
jgi:DNA topoisomerase III